MELIRLQHSDGPRILFVCFADSTHTQSWLNLLKGTNFNVRVFASNVNYGGLYPPQPWNYPTYVLLHPDARSETEHVISLLPKSKLLRSAVSWGQKRFFPEWQWLNWV